MPTQPAKFPVVRNSRQAPTLPSRGRVAAKRGGGVTAGEGCLEWSGVEWSGVGGGGAGLATPPPRRAPPADPPTQWRVGLRRPVQPLSRRSLREGCVLRLSG